MTLFKYLVIVQEMLRGVPLSRMSILDSVEDQIAADARFEHIPQSLDLEAAFDEVMEDREPEFAFTDLLAECRSPVISATSTFNQTRKQVR